MVTTNRNGVHHRSVDATAEAQQLPLACALGDVGTVGDLEQQPTQFAPDALLDQLDSQINEVNTPASRVSRFTGDKYIARFPKNWARLRKSGLESRNAPSPVGSLDHSRSGAVSGSVHIRLTNALASRERIEVSRFPQSGRPPDIRIHLPDRCDRAAALILVAVVASAYADDLILGLGLAHQYISRSCRRRSAILLSL